MLGTIVEDRYLVEAELGAGAMGHVYRARHIKVGRQVAIKVMHPELARVSTIVERFAREARIAARLDHPNLISVLDVGMTAERLPLIVLELAPGVPLFQLCLEPMARDIVVDLMRQLLRGLDHAHDAGLIHRDLKPDNILVEQCADGSLIPRIVDFGIAVYNRDDDPIASARLTEANTVIGTPAYMSPEQAMAKPVDSRTDLFSMGVIMYELLAGMTPFNGTGVEVACSNACTDAPSIAERSGVQVDPLLEVFVRKLMARRLSDRFQTAHEALSMLELIERDRLAAAKAFAGQLPAAAPVAPVLAVGSGPFNTVDESDIVEAYTPPVRAISEAPEISGPVAAAAVAAVRRSTKITRVEHVAGMRPARRRMLWAGALAAAALTAVVGWSSLRTHGAAPKVDAALTSDVRLESPTLTPPSMTVSPIEAPVAAAPVASVAITPAAAKSQVAAAPAVAKSQIAAAPAVAKSQVAAAPAVWKSQVAAPAVAKSQVAAKPAAKLVVKPATKTVAFAASAPTVAPSAPVAVVAPVASPTPAVETPASLANRYAAVGRMLRGAPDELWAKYRLIRINDALKTEASRKQAQVALASIERELKR